MVMPPTPCVIVLGGRSQSQSVCRRKSWVDSPRAQLAVSAVRPINCIPRVGTPMSVVSSIPELLLGTDADSTDADSTDATGKCQGFIMLT